MKQHAKIKIEYDLGHSLIGQVSDHPNQSRFVKPLQQTSRIVARHEDGTIETENTIYTVIQ